MSDFLRPFVDTPTLGSLNPLALTLAQQLPLEFGNSPHDAQQQPRHRGVFPSERQAFFDELDLDASAGEAGDQPAEVVEVGSEPVKGVDDDSVAFAGEFQQGLELGPVDVLAADFIGKDLVDLNAFELAVGVMVETADVDVPQALAGAHDVHSVRLRSMTLQESCQKISKSALS